MVFWKGLQKISSILRNIAWESRVPISASDLFQSLILKAKKEFPKRSVLQYKALQQSGLRWEFMIGGINS